MTAGLGSVSLSIQEWIYMENIQEVTHYQVSKPGHVNQTVK